MAIVCFSVLELYQLDNITTSASIRQQPTIGWFCAVRSSDSGNIVQTEESKTMKKEAWIGQTV